MSYPDGPRSPFAFTPDEPLLGEGRFLSTHRRRWMSLGLAVGVVLAVIIALVLPGRLAARDLDPSVNLRTGLPDGTYVLTPSSSMHEGERCWFRGPVSGQDPSAEVLVSGRGDVQCARQGDYVGRVHIRVTGGRAEIDRAAGY